MTSWWAGWWSRPGRALILLFGTTTARLIRLHTDAVVTEPDG
ncbi:hypothetical protein [Micromonospora sp. NPDC049679]